MAQHLRSFSAYGQDKYKLFFWRTKGGTEVDFIVYGQDGIWAIEVKQAKNIRLSDLKALQEFKQDYPETLCIFLYRGNEKIKTNNIMCIPCDVF